MRVDQHTISANGADLYCEVRGAGPTVLFISGATGDAGHFEHVADLLASEFTVVTYDRRGNSRSPRPMGWNSTSVAEQADDAAALLTVLGVAPAAVYGNSYGATIALDLLIRYPNLVRGAMLHEPPLPSVLEKPDEVQAAVGSVVQEGMTAGGPSKAVEHFMRFAAGDANWEGMKPSLRQRMSANGETLFGVEMGTFEPYRPDDATMAAIRVPTLVLVSEESASFFHAVASWLAGQLGVEVRHTPGTHLPQLDHPEELVSTIRPFLQDLP
ncbi:alpha/beta fold hydrolase [Streptomyces sp. NPDC093591]|uniref:alpha/beta fold hydrolase n=1 Tax=Streptomyces sp. NPDC093591 TaxID=3366044 RepID=UPI0037F75821